MRLWTLGSGSRGNAALLECGDTRVLVDAGFSARRIGERLGELGVDPKSIAALVLTHEHRDHISGVESAVKRWGWAVHGTRGTLDGMGKALAGATTHAVTAGVGFAIGGIEFEPFRTSHDAAEPMGVVAGSTRSGTRIAIVTDLGIVTESVRTAVQRADVLLVESNHDEVMLASGPYPYHLKRRVAGNWGHLSNRAAGQLVVEAMHRGMQQVVLAHLSETNNTPAMALEAMQGTLRKARFRGQVAAAPQHGVAGPFGAAGGLGGQLSLF